MLYDFPRPIIFERMSTTEEVKHKFTPEQFKKKKEKHKSKLEAKQAKRKEKYNPKKKLKNKQRPKLKLKHTKIFSNLNLKKL